MARLAATALAVALAWSCGAFAQDSDLARIREEINHMKENYERRIEALEKRLAEAEGRARTPGKESQAATPEASAGSAAPARINTENLFNPSISLILQGTYANTSKNPETFEINRIRPVGRRSRPPFAQLQPGRDRAYLQWQRRSLFSSGCGRRTHAGKRSRSRRGICAITRAAARARAEGRTIFFRRRLSERDPPARVGFRDAPLPYQAFLAGRLKQDGVQLKWVAPTPFFLQLGAEASNGKEFPGSDRNKNGIGGSAAFAHVGGDIGASYAWRAGVSYVRASPRERTYDDVDSLDQAVSNSFSGNARLWVADAVLRWAPDGNSTRHNFKLQGEYFRFRQRGDLTYDDNAGSGTFGSVTDRFEGRQSGWYLQACGSSCRAGGSDIATIGSTTAISTTTSLPAAAARLPPISRSSRRMIRSASR